MLLVRRLILVYILIIFCNIKYSLEDNDGDSNSSDKSLASGLSEDMDKLSENVNEISEEYAEDEPEDTGTPEEKRKKKLARKYNATYEKEFERAQKVVDKQYNRFVKGTFESLDLIDYTTEHLKRFWFTGQCRRNYDQICPKGWTETDNICKAPVDYTGVCNDSKDFRGLGPEEKEDFAWRCQVEWPCVNESPLFEGKECPFEWAPISDTLCLAPKTYNGICSPIMDISNFDVKKKSLYEQKCNIRWRRVANKTLNRETNNQNESMKNKISGIIEEGIIRLL